MNRKNVIGIVLCTFLFVGSFLFVGGIAAYWSFTAFLVVGAGLGITALLSYPFDKILVAMKEAKVAYTAKQITVDQLIFILLDLAVKSKVDGVLSLDKIHQKISISFLRNALAFLVDNYKESEIRDFLSTEMMFFKLRRGQSERVFQNLARVAPAFGVAGSVIGLIGLLMGIDDTQIILKSIPVAFISTLYGVLIGNMLFAPIAEAIQFNTRNELLNQKLIMEAIIAIHREQNPYKLEKKLCSFLAPEQRAGHAEKVRSITKQYLQKRRQENKSALEQREELQQSPIEMGESGTVHMLKNAVAS